MLMPLLKPNFAALESNTFGKPEKASQNNVVALKIARHQYQIKDYAKSLKYYDQVMALRDNVAFISRQHWVLYAVCLPLLTNEVGGRTDDTFSQTMKLLEQQLKDTCIADDKQRFRLCFLHALVHEPALRSLRDELRSLNLTTAEEATLNEFWKRCRAELAEQTTPSLERQFQQFMESYIGPNVHPDVWPAPQR